MKRHCGGSTPRTLIPVWTLPLRHISSSLCVARPFTNGVEWGWKKCTDPMVGGARSIHSMTRAHPPLVQSERVKALPHLVKGFLILNTQLKGFHIW